VIPGVAHSAAASKTQALPPQDPDRRHHVIIISGRHHLNSEQAASFESVSNRCWNSARSLSAFTLMPAPQTTVLVSVSATNPENKSRTSAFADDLLVLTGSLKIGSDL